MSASRKPPETNPDKTDSAKNASLPPLVSLRVLEASARLKSFTKAAQELSVTPSAVTQHIRTIETWVGRPLFRRTGREVIVSDLVESVLARLHEGFELINEAAQSLRSGGQRSSTVWVCVSPSFASKWLLPRLDLFREAHPDIEVWVASSDTLIDFHKSEIDLAVWYDSGEHPHLVVQKLMEEAVLPVCSPAVIEKFGPFKKPEDLLRARLLHDSAVRSDSSPTWPMWFRARGIKDPEIYRGPRYNRAGLIIDEAVAGRGIALVRYTLAQHDIEEGRLISLLSNDPRHHTTYAHWLIWPKGRSLSLPARQFISWIKMQTSDGLEHGAVSSAVPELNLMAPRAVLPEQLPANRFSERYLRLGTKFQRALGV